MDFIIENKKDTNLFMTQKDPNTVEIKRLSDLHVCPRCRKPLVPAISMSGAESPIFRECKSCGTLVNTFYPLPHQADFHRNPRRYKMQGGGYGSGKSACDIQYAIKHLLLIQGSRVCVAARSYPALETTFLEEFKGMFPEKLIKSKNDQKHEYHLTNGSTLLLRSFDDPTKLKSMNNSLEIIVEASDVPESGFDMFKSRLRNTIAMIPQLDSNGNPVQYYDAEHDVYKTKYLYDARHICLETNPASNWVKKFLEDSKEVTYYGSSMNEGYNMSKEPDEGKYTQIIPTDANPYLPETYIQELTKGKSEAWIRQFVKGSFNFNANLIFPNVGLCIKEDHPLPKEYNEKGQRVLWYLIGLDYGIVDNTHVIYGALSTEEHKLYIYDELVINEVDVKTICTEYRKNTRINGTNLNGLLMKPKFDGRSYNKRESDLHTIGGAFEAQGLFFDPAFPNWDVRIVKLNSLINHGQLEIYSHCEFLIEELLNYKWKLDKNGNITDKPEDGNDHGISALGFIVSDLPHNLIEMTLDAYLKYGERIIHDSVKPKEIKKDHIYNPLEEGTKHGHNRNSTFNLSSHSSFDTRCFDMANEDLGGINNEEGNRTFGCYIPTRQGHH